MPADPTRSGRVFFTLDALRGLAALIVVSRHEVLYFLPVHFAQNWTVDMFFVLSGFVLARSYEERLRTSMLFKDFLLTRLIRLYPIYLLGVLAGVAAALACGVPAGGTFTIQLLLALALVPDLLGKAIFPLDGPTWSLFFELFANCAWAAGVRKALGRLLPLAVAVSAVGLVICGVVAGHLDVGWQRSSFVAGFPRAAYSFGAGVLLWRHGHRIKLPSVPHWALLAAAAALMWLPSPPMFKSAYAILMVLVIVPALVLLATRTEPKGEVAKVYRFLGVISYGVYALHMPLGGLVWAAFEARGLHVRDYAPWIGLPFLALLVVLAWAASEFYDVPLRGRLRQVFAKRRVAAPAGAATL